ncbi:flagellar biosynthesis protein FlhA [Aestuariibacter sp. AA17]|uniref:Flagellar biosynthesis protein FlhA n=1 Tax=Fluctibacter corallii TaxID=2984329 RepID=A0ABT3A9P7_9ALTE|nr:flagellar biosynthesis protein FlhA [Aestuariibacter sp. AA17]MCV2885324.1 flagellar biosynthesis protein FlhA [Aestuariibacter sp. AA17]
MKMFAKRFGIGGEAFFALGVVAILMLLFVPVSKWLLDILIILNVSLALLVLLLTFYSERPLDFSTFPSVLLLATLFRLGLNISSTRLILDNGDAGKVIMAVGDYVVAGNYVIGLVIFFILVVVQFVVVTNGAQRVAEVAARFTLDSMPGKQMSIDADLNMGIIDEKEAQHRRAMIEKEANFYGAMDGATKFVKGDAIAGIVIILINIIGGLSIGVAQGGLSWQQALHLYTLLTVGDGIVTQIPSLIIAVGTGIIITRAATQGNLADQLFTQVVTHPFTLALVAVLLAAAAMAPGLPGFSLLFVSAVFAVFGFVAYRKHNAVKEDIDEVETQDEPSGNGLSLTIAMHETLFDDSKEIQSEVKSRYETFKQQYENKYGLLLPDIDFHKDDGVDENTYSIHIRNIEYASGAIYPTSILAIDPADKLSGVDGIRTKEPAYGLNAVWLKSELGESAKQQGLTIVQPDTILLTHITEFIKQHAQEFVSRSFVDQVLEEQRDQNETLVAEVVPTQLAIADVHQIFVNLIQEKVPLHNAGLMFEVLADKARTEKNVEILTEFVRQRLKVQLTNPLADKAKTLHIISLNPNFERKLMSAANNQDGQALLVSPQDLDHLIKQITVFAEKAIGLNVEPILLVNPMIRRSVWRTITRSLPMVHVLSTAEIPNHIQIDSLGVVSDHNLQVA